MSAGIDYGWGTVNRDKANGIHYGVIAVRAIAQAWSDSSESDYGEATCPKCEGRAVPLGPARLTSEPECDGLAHSTKGGSKKWIIAHTS